MNLSKNAESNNLWIDNKKKAKILSVFNLVIFKYKLKAKNLIWYTIRDITWLEERYK